MVPGNVGHHTLEVQLGGLDPPVVQAMAAVPGEQRGGFEHTDLAGGCAEVIFVRYQIIYLVLISNGDLAGVVGDIHAGDLDIVVTDAGDDLDPVEVVGEDDDVTPGRVSDQADSLYRPNSEGFVPDIASPGEDLVTLHDKLHV